MLALSHLRDRGYDNSGDGGERDEIRRSTAILSGDFALTETLTLDFTLRRSREHYDYDATNSGAADWQGYVVDDPLPYVDRDETTARLGFSHEMLGGRLVQRFSVQTTRNSTSYDGWAPTDTRTDAAHYRLSYGLDGQPVDSADHILTGMLEWEEASSSSNPGYDRRTNSLALEYRGEIGGLSLQAGVRHDRNSAFANATTWTLAASYRFADSGVRVHGSAGTGVVDPSYFELFGNSCYMGSCTYGNAALTPEYNRSFDLGVELPVFGGRGLVDVTLFHSTLTDAIEYYYDAGLGYSTYRNVAGDGTRRGVEISGRLQATDDLSLRLSYTYTDATNPDGSVATRRPEHQLALGATWAFAAGRGSLSADLRYVAGSWDNQWFGAYALAELPAYTTVDLAATYQLTQDVTLIGRVSNLFDEGTMDAWGYPGRGRAAYVGLRARF